MMTIPLMKMNLITNDMALYYPRKFKIGMYYRIKASAGTQKQYWGLRAKIVSDKYIHIINHDGTLQCHGAGPDWIYDSEDVLDELIESIYKFNFVTK